MCFRSGCLFRRGLLDSGSLRKFIRFGTSISMYSELLSQRSLNQKEAAECIRIGLFQRGPACSIVLDHGAPFARRLLTIAGLLLIRRSWSRQTSQIFTSIFITIE